MILFTYLKIILLHYFQFLVFRNKRFPNGPLRPPIWKREKGGMNLCSLPYSQEDPSNY